MKEREIRMRGITKIELKDIHNGEKETIVEENLITDAVPDLMRGVPFYYQQQEIQNNFLPLWENAMGGIILFDQAVNEDPACYYEAFNIKKVGYSSAGASNLVDPKRGSRNTIESEKLEQGIRMVWDFTTAQANGTIRSVCLTSSEGGEGEYGAVGGMTQKNVRYITENLFSSTSANAIKSKYRMVSIESDTEDKQDMWYSLYQNKDSIVIKKHVFMNGYLSLTKNTVIFAGTDDASDVTVPFSNLENFPVGSLVFADGNDGFWYGFYTLGNKTGNASIYVLKIEKETKTIKSMGYRSFSGFTVRMDGTGNNYLPVISNGYLYLAKCDTTQGAYNFYSYASSVVYKISLNNFTDVTEIETGMLSSVWCSYVGASRLPDGSILYQGYKVNPDDSVIKVLDVGSGTMWFYVESSSGYQFYSTVLFYKTFMFTLIGSSGTYYCMAGVNPYYLASINNLDSPIVKTADKTMKITYTLLYE